MNLLAFSLAAGLIAGAALLKYSISVNCFQAERVYFLMENADVIDLILSKRIYSYTFWLFRRTEFTPWCNLFYPEGIK